MISRPKPAPPVIYLPAALSRVGGNEQILIDIARFFVEDTPKILDEMAQSLQSRDHQEAARRAHSLKGLAANFDAVACVASAQALEDLCNAQKWDQAEGAFEHVRQEISRVTEALQNELKVAPARTG